MWRNTRQRYGRLGVLLHWVSAVLILAMYLLGMRAAGLPKGPERAAAFALHATVGYLLLFVMTVRLVWLFADQQPDPPRGLSPLRLKLYKGVHHLLYVLIFAMLLSGMLAFNFGQALGGIPNSIHRALRFVLLFFIGLHIFAAFQYQFTKGNLMARMGLPWFPGKREPAWEE